MVQLAIEKQTGGTQAPTQAIEALIDRSLKRLAVETYSTGEMPRLTKTFTIPLVAGVADLSTINDLLVPSIPDAYITHPASDWALQWAAHRKALDLPPSKEFVYFTLFNNSIIVKHGDPDANISDDNLSVTASRIPLMSDVPKDLEPELVKIGVLEFFDSPKAAPTRPLAN